MMMLRMMVLFATDTAAADSDEDDGDDCLS